MVVLKIGGSLYDSPRLVEWLSGLPQNITQSVVIVPGGGPFADQVRAASKKWKLPLDCSHDMAVLGMQQFAHMMIGLNKDLILASRGTVMLDAQNKSNVTVWAPYDDVLHADDIEKDWQTTSDSLALWLATKIDAPHLCLVKSAITAGKSLHQLISEGIIDNNFGKILPDYPGQVHFYHAADTQQFMHDVNSDFSS